MKNYIFIAGDSETENIVKVRADDLKKAKEKYSLYIWSYDEMIVEDIDERMFDYWSDFIPENRDLNLEEYHEKFKNNLANCFSEEVANELYNFYDNEDLKYTQLSDQAKREIGLRRMDEDFSYGWLKFFDEDEIDII